MKSLMLTCVLLGCQSADAIDDKRPPPRRSEQVLAIRFHMYRHLDFARAIERLLVRGKLDDARALARAIAEAPDTPGTEAWARQAALVRDRAASLAAAKDSDEACRAAGLLAGACASCHVQAGIQAYFDEPPPEPPDRETIPDRMARHTWAANRLWEGVIGDADEAWRSGTTVLAQTPLPIGVLEPERLGAARQLQRLAVRAGQRITTDTVAERAELYGEILVACVGCHSIGSTAPRDLADVDDSRGARP